MDNRRVAGAQRILEQELEGLVPVVAPCGSGLRAAGRTDTQFFQGEPEVPCASSPRFRCKARGAGSRRFWKSSSSRAPKAAASAWWSTRSPIRDR